MKKVFIHRFSGILSAYGLGLADVVHDEQEPCSKVYNKENLEFFEQRFKALKEITVKKLKEQGFTDDKIVLIPFLNMRYAGTDFTIMTEVTKEQPDYAIEFEKKYQRMYGFKIQVRQLCYTHLQQREEILLLMILEFAELEKLMKSKEFL